MTGIVPPPSPGSLGPDEGSLLDAAALAERCFGDRDLEADLLALFVGQCRSVGPALLAATDPDLIRDAAHALRGSAAAIGADPLARALAAVEESPGAFATDARPGLAGLLDRTIAASQARLAGNAPLAKPDGLA